MPSDCELVHIYQEKNVVADNLANWRYNMNLTYHYFENPTEYIETHLLDDMSGVSKT